MKKMSVKKLFSITLATLMLVMCFANSVLAVGNMDSNVMYSSDIAMGKVFEHGNNQVVNSENQLDTYITNVKIIANNDTYSLIFDFNGDNYSIEAYMVKAKSNNHMEDHYLLSAQNFEDNTYDIVSIFFTTKANEYDLLPVNREAMNGREVLTIIFKNKHNSNIYYWETVLNKISRTANVINTVDDCDVVENANEYYYMEANPESITFSGTFDLNKNYASLETYNAYKEWNYNITRSTNNNPYYGLGVPNSAFQYATKSWKVVDPNEIPGTNEFLPIQCYTYTYDKWGSDYIYTDIMIIGHVITMPTSSTTISSAGTYYEEAKATYKIEVYDTPRTVIFYPEQLSYSFKSGSEGAVTVSKPSIGLQKNSTGVPHVLTGRYTFSNATAIKSSIFDTSVLVINRALVCVCDAVTFGIVSTVFDIADIITQASMDVAVSEGTVAIETYSPSATYQKNMYGKIMGGISEEIKGVLENKEQYFGITCWFATPEGYEDEVINIWPTYSITPER